MRRRSDHALLPFHRPPPLTIVTTTSLVPLLAGFWYFLLPLYMWVKDKLWPRTGPLADKF